MMKGVTRRPVQRLAAGKLLPAVDDDVVHEEPLEIRVSGDTLAVTMRTPGADRELAAGFLLSEGLISSRDDLGGIAHCGRPTDEGYGNTIEITPAPGAVIDIERTRRGTLTTSACGVCGRQTIDDVLERMKPVHDGPQFASSAIRAAVEGLRDLQPRFALTGGLHAAALLDERGEVLAAFEDIGRHNAVDKAIGALLVAGKLDRAALLVVSSRAGFEIVQKACAAGVPVVASVSAPSSLAIDLANATNVTLCGFVRGGGMSVYAHPERLT
jgi:FdhD protein